MDGEPEPGLTRVPVANDLVQPGVKAQDGSKTR